VPGGVVMATSAEQTDASDEAWPEWRLAADLLAGLGTMDADGPIASATPGR